MVGLLGTGANIAFGIGGKAGGITGTALAGAEGIVGAATSGHRAGGGGGAGKGEGAGPGKKAQQAQMVMGLLQQLSQLGRSNPDALRSILASNPEAAQALSTILG